MYVFLLQGSLIFRCPFIQGVDFPSLGLVLLYMNESFFLSIFLGLLPQICTSRGIVKAKHVLNNSSPFFCFINHLILKMYRAMFRIFKAFKNHFSQVYCMKDHPLIKARKHLFTIRELKNTKNCSFSQQSKFS